MRLPPSPPPFFLDDAASILSQARSVVDEAKSLQDSLVSEYADATPTFASVLLPLSQNENHRLSQQQRLGFYKDVSPDPQVRDASEEAERLFSRFDRETFVRRDLYNLISAVQAQGDSLDQESTYYLVTLLRSFETAGLGMSLEKQNELHQVSEAISKISTEYILNHEQATASLWFSREELDGLDSNLIAGLQVTTGKSLLPIESTRYRDVMSNARCEATRRQVYYAYGEASACNVALLQQASVLRTIKAQLLGHRTAAGLAMARSMEKSPETIQAFLDDLLARLEPARSGLNSELRSLKQQDLHVRGEHDDGHFYEWDRTYYTRRLLALGKQVNTRIVSQFFELFETIKRMLQVFARLFGMIFDELDDNKRDLLSQSHGGNALKWDHEVRLFAVWDDSEHDGEEAAFMGYLYMDLYARPGKRPGASDLPISPHYLDTDGLRRYAATCLVCNFVKPENGSPALLEHSDVILLFHELGHGIHDLVGQTKYARFSGASCAHDFNEVPSQMLEKWCWYPETLQMLSRHYSTLSPEYAKHWQLETESRSGADSIVDTTGALPKTLIDELVHSKQKHDLSRTLGILNISMFDMALKSFDSSEAARVADVTKLYHGHLRNVLGLDVPEDPLPPVPTSMPHLFTIDNMYPYLTSQIYASDIFATAFAADPMNREQGLRYRRMIIGKGSSVDEMLLMQDFLGRPPNAEAFFRSLGLV